MALTDNKKIAIWPTVKAACRMLWTMRKQHIALSLVFILPSLIIQKLKPDAEVQLYIISLFNLFWVSALINLWHRLFLVGPTLLLRTPIRQFLETSLKLAAFYIKESIILGLAIVAAFCAIGWPLSIWYTHFPSRGGHMGILQGLIIVLAIAFVFLTSTLHFMPISFGISIEKHFSFRKSWSLMKGHAPRLLLTVTLLVAGAFLAFTICLALAGIALSPIMGHDKSPYTLLIFAALISPLLMAIWVLPMAALAIVYRDLVPQQEHLVDVTV